MKIEVLQEQLAKALALTSRFVNPRAQLPILGNILFSADKTKLSLLATNLEVSLALSIGAKVKVAGQLALPAKVVNELFTSLPKGTLSLEAEKEALKITADNFSGTIQGMNAADFPAVPQTLTKKAFGLPKEKFLKALSQVIFAASTDETRPVLTGILFIFDKENLVMTSTDGFRLSQKKIKLQGKSDLPRFIVPRTSLVEFVRIAGSSEQSLAMEFREQDNQVVFGLGGVTLASRLVEGEFPDFEKIIPKSSILEVNVEKAIFLQAIKAAAVFARDSANVVNLKITKGTLEINAQSNQSGNQKMSLEAKTEGEELSISYNYRFLEEFLNNLEGESVQMSFSGANAPGVFKDPKDPDFFHLIMPVKV